MIFWHSLVWLIPTTQPSAPLAHATTSVATPAAAPPAWPTLSLGDSGPDVESLDMALAALGYLPMTYQAPLKSLSPGMLAHPPTTYWHWTDRATPVSLKALWRPRVYTVMTRGAVMAFEWANQLPTDGVAGPQVFAALSRDLAHHAHNRLGYTYVLVQKNYPETLTLWHNGVVALKSLANTGIPQSPTNNGTWPVYLRYRSQDMSGINPFGVPYNDPGVPYVNYFNGGDAVHGFWRAAYGYPQSLGCVELPVANARIAWNYIQYGTLVTVEN